MAVPFRRKPGGKEKGVKKPHDFFSRVKNQKIMKKCDNCNNLKLAHFVCKNNICNIKIKK